jgi:TnpA family transposase
VILKETVLGTGCRAQRTIFVATYLRSRELQREITEGLNVVEAY